jgi:SAM-dependent methyltransferase
MPSTAEDHPYRDFEHAGWERAAPFYAATFETITALFAEPLLEAVGAGPRTRVLDVACGNGFIAALAASHGATVEGIDFSGSMVAAARSRHPSLSFRQGDAEALPYADGTFDAVVIGFGVHHFPFPARALSEARRVLCPAGRLGFTVWAPIDQHMIQKVVVDAVQETGNPAASLPVPPAGDICDVDACARMLREAGFISPYAETLAAQASIQSAHHLIQLLLDGTVRMSAVIKSLSPEKHGTLEAAIERSIARYRQGSVFRIPAAAILAVGTKTA